MATSKSNVNLYNGSCYVLVLLLVATSIHTSLFVEGLFDTIKSDNGEVIDCVNVYEQPSLSHPLLRDHTIQIEPRSYISTTQPNKPLPKLTQSWHKNGHCSKGTIPIRRQLQTDPFSDQPPQTLQGMPHNEHATVIAFASPRTKFSGASATINLWNPLIGGPGDFSSSQIWVVAGDGEDINTLQAGWIVFPEKYGDNRTRLFISWTRDSYRRTGCFDHDCSGFIQVNNQYILGGAISPVSNYNGEQFEINIAIQQDKTTGNWWLKIQDIPIGYWPAQIFTRFANGADQLIWGGQIFDSVGFGQHTITEMGSGHFPDEGPKRASYFRKIKYFDESNTLADPVPESLFLDMTNPFCYSSMVSLLKDPNDGVYFYYGGPGLNENCR